MVKAYFGYKFDTLIGAIANNGGLIFENIAYTIVDQYVLILNLKTQQIIEHIQIENKNTKISKIAILQNTLALGYQDGEIILYNLIDKEIQCRFFNHQSEITQLIFLSETILISGSLDTSIIVWDIADQSLQFRLTGHSNAITALEIIILEDQQLAIMQQFLVSGSKDGLIKIWDLQLECSVATLSSMHSEVSCLQIYDDTIIICTNSDEVIFKKCKLLQNKLIIEDNGLLKRQSFIRPVQSRYIQDKLFILNNEKKIEMYKHKQGRKSQKIETLGELFTYSTIITNVNKIHSFQVLQNKSTLKLYLFTQENQIIIKEIINDIIDEQSSIQIEQFSNQIKQIQLTQNDTKLLILSTNKCYLYDNETTQQISKLEGQNNYYSLCILPKNKYYLLGDEKGNLQLIDINQNEIIFENKVHNSIINNIQYHENCKAFNGLVIMTTEIERKVNFIELFFNKTQNQLEFQIVNTIYLKENIRNASFSNNGQYYAFSLYNNLIQIFYCDSHKVYLELYGHSLPVFTFSFTTDDTILISGGADKNIKLWATDFGNCKKTIKSHSAEIVQIKTVNETHYFFSGCKDNIIKYWDGDTYQLILQFNEALSGIQCLTIGCIGDLFYSASRNGVIRKYIQTKEQVFVSEEEEKRLQEQILQDLQNKNKQQSNFEQGQDQIIKDLTLVQIGQQKLQETEQLMDTLEKIKQYREEEEMGENPNQDFFYNKNVTEYLFDLLLTSDLNSLMKFLHHQHFLILINEMNTDIALKQYPVIVNRLLNYIFNKIDSFGLNSHEIMMKVINIRTQLQTYFKKQKKIVGFNLDILNIMLQDINKNQDDFIFE